MSAIDRTRTMRVGILKTTCATLQATRLVSSCEVQAISMSVSAAPASASTSGLMPLPTTPRRSKRVSRSRRRTPSVSMTVMSFFSPSRLSATLSPTRPAPKIRIFIKNAPCLYATYRPPHKRALSSGGSPVIEQRTTPVLRLNGRIITWRRAVAVSANGYARVVRDAPLPTIVSNGRARLGFNLALRLRPARCT